MGEREEVDVHLRCEAFGEVGGGHPAGEGYQIVWVVSTRGKMGREWWCLADVCPSAFASQPFAKVDLVRVD